MNLRKLITMIVGISIICANVCGCSDISNISNINAAGKINIVCTIYPQYDWVINLLGDNADKYNVSLLVQDGTDLHSFQPSTRDIVTIAGCDLFIHVGGTSDLWVQDVLDVAGADKVRVINMLDVLGDDAYVEEIVEGMDDGHEGHDDDIAEGLDDGHGEHTDDIAEGLDDGHEGHTEEEDEYDEHVWLSLKNARVICSAITNALISMDGQGAGEYKNALDVYESKLNSLDEEYANAVDGSKNDTLVFGDRFPFRYMTEDYGIKYYAAFPGCSAETEASFKTIVFLANKVRELPNPTVCVTESSDKSMAYAIINNADAENGSVIVFDSLQSITHKDIEEGTSYLEIMASNLEALKAALN